MPEITISEKGVRVIVSTAITERVELYFDNPDPKKEIPLVVQRSAPDRMVNEISDPWGNLVVLLAIGVSNTTIEFKTDKNEFLNHLKVLLDD